jgi:D-amino peptidase
MSKSVLISVDMEGLTGVVHPNQTIPQRSDYERFRNIMLREANAAITGAFQGGASSVVVNDSHDGMLNLKIEDLDSRAQLISGFNKPLCMMEGLSPDFSCVFFIGYHSMASGLGILSHTMTGIISKAYVNDVPASEGIVNAMIAGHFNVPVALVAGDQYAVEEVKKVIPTVTGVVVKTAIDRYSALNRPIAEVERELVDKASKSVENSDALKCYKPGAPIKITVEYTQPSIAARVAYLPFAKRMDTRTIQFESQNPLEAYMNFWSATLLAGTAQEQIYG